MRSHKEKRDWRLPGLFYADDLVLSGESEEDMSSVEEEV